MTTQTKIARLMKKLVAEADAEGSSRPMGGVWLSTGENLTADQKGWECGCDDTTDHDHGCMKTFDFSASPYWLTTDDGAEPVAITGADDEDLIKHFRQYA